MKIRPMGDEIFRVEVMKLTAAFRSFTNATKPRMYLSVIWSSGPIRRISFCGWATFNSAGKYLETSIHLLLVSSALSCTV